MSKAKLNFIVDMMLLVSFGGLLWTGILIHQVLPPGIRGGHGLTLWGLNRHEYGDIHLFLGVVMLVFSVIHIWLHWQWFSNKFAGMFGISRKEKVVSFVILAFVSIILIASLFLVKSQVIMGPDDHDDHGHGGHHGQKIQQQLREGKN